jgi:hypothetical protein
MTNEITVIVQPRVIATVNTGYQAPYRKYNTVAEMLAVTGKAGDLAYCYNNPDVFYKWSTQQKMWIVANI